MDKNKPKPLPPPDPMYVLRADSTPISAVQFLHSEHDTHTPSLHDSQAGTARVVTGSQEGDMAVWCLKTRQPERHWHAHPSSVTGIRQLPSERLATIGCKDSVKVWLLNQPAPSEPSCQTVISLEDYLGFCNIDVLMRASSVMLAIPKDDGLISVWDVDSEKQRNKLCHVNPKEIGAVMSIKCVNKLFAVIAVYEGGLITLWDAEKSRIKSKLKIEGTPMCIEFDENINKGVVGTASDKLFVFSRQDSPEEGLQLVKEVTLTNEGVSSCVTRGDSRIFVTGGWDHRLRVFSWAKARTLAVLSWHTDTVSCLHYSHCPALGSPSVLAAASSDGSVSLWSFFET